MSIRLTLLRLLERILVLPTAPFHENFVISFICEELRALGFDFRRDSYGNIVAGCGRGEDGLAWVAHMDHPGFAITEVRGKRTEAAWFGGVALKYFSHARVVIYDPLSGLVRTRGKVEKIWQNSQGRVDKLALRIDGQVEEGDFGFWNLVPFRRRGDLISTKAADDLVGCAVILAALAELKRERVPGRVLGLFTRAEEQGFIGTLGSIRNGLLTPATAVVSVETSKALPGAVLGGGPAIRLGDRSSMFHNGMVLFMDHVAREIRNIDSHFVYQRRVMDGGTCEATPFQLNSHVAGGIAIPLRNYHNQGKNGIGPEGVRLGDAVGAARLLVEMAKKMDQFDAPIKKIRQRWEAALEKYGKKLQEPE